MRRPWQKEKEKERTERASQKQRERFTRKWKGGGCWIEISSIMIPGG